MNITADRIVAAPGSILYNILGSDAAANTACTTNKADDVSVGVFSADGAQMILESGLSFDGGNAISYHTHIHRSCPCCVQYVS